MAGNQLDSNFVEGNFGAGIMALSPTVITNNTSVKNHNVADANLIALGYPTKGYGIFCSEGYELYENSCCGNEDYDIMVEYNGIQALPGDYITDGKVTIDEVQRCINQLLGIAEAGPCCDVNDDSQVTIDEVQKVINAFLSVS